MRHSDAAQSIKDYPDNNCVWGYDRKELCRKEKGRAIADPASLHHSLSNHFILPLLSLLSLLPLLPLWLFNTAFRTRTQSCPLIEVLPNSSFSLPVTVSGMVSSATSCRFKLWDAAKRKEV
jgi:hypothetical protein